MDYTSRLLSNFRTLPRLAREPQILLPMPILPAAETHQYPGFMQGLIQQQDPYLLCYPNSVLLGSRMMILSGPSMARCMTP